MTIDYTKPRVRLLRCFNESYMRIFPQRRYAECADRRIQFYMETAQREDKASQRLKADRMKSDSGVDQMQAQVSSSCLTSRIIR